MPSDLSCPTQCSYLSPKAAADNTPKNGHGGVPIHLYVWTLKPELHIITYIHVSKNIIL